MEIYGCFDDDIVRAGVGKCLCLLEIGVVSGLEAEVAQRLDESSRRAKVARDLRASVGGAFCGLYRRRVDFGDAVFKTIVSEL